jgi:hypothetical protein
MVMSANNPPRTRGHRRNARMDDFTKKHLKTWLQESVFSGDRRHVGKIIREYVKRHPEALTEGRSWPEIQRLAEASGYNPQAVSILQKKRETRERAAQIRAAATGRNPRLTREQKDYWLAQKDYWENVEGAISRKAKKYAWEDVYKKWPELRHSSGQNPSELLVMAANPRVEVVHSPNPPTEEIVEEFTGREVEYMDVYNEPHMPRGRYAQLGPLIALYIKPAKGGQVQRIGAAEAVGHKFPESWGGKPPIVVCDSTAKQIYFVDGSQDITACLEAFLGAGAREGVVTLGQARRIDYQCRKEHVASPDEDLWKHDHGEENGVLPTVLFDTKNKRLLYEGGDYRIEGPWIRN